MSSVAVIAHKKKTFGGGLDELRSRLADAGVTDLIWREVPKSKRAPGAIREALDAGADLVFVWGGDGTVQRCADTLAGSGVAMAILPAGTANLFATNLGIPRDLERAVHVGLHGRRRCLDAGRLNGERFVVMAGAGFDARMIRDADGTLKDRAGRLAYVWTGARNLDGPRTRTTITVDGRPWFRGKTSCVLVGNVSHVVGGLQVFDGARPDDGRLELGVVTARTSVQWARVFLRIVARRPQRSRFVRVTSGTKIDVRFADKTPYELDGGARGRTRHMKIRVDARVIDVCVPEDGS